MSNVSIIGAGITGPAVALNLAAAGHDVTVYEQRPPDGLYSAGILGITSGLWSDMQGLGVRLETFALDDSFRVYGGMVVQSPFRTIAWVDLHTALVARAAEYGAEFRWSTKADANHMDTEFTIDAGGIFTAAHTLRSHYSGFAIYRGTTPNRYAEDVFNGFTAVHGLPHNGYFTVGQSHYGASWALFAPRNEPMHHATVTTATPPPEASLLPPEYAYLVRHTPDMIVSYMSDWDVPTRFSSPDLTHFTLGDANGPVRPVTTSGANLALMAGMAAPKLLSRNARVIRPIERRLLERRAYDIALGQELEGPEIGGTAEDALFVMHHNALFQAGQR